MRSQNKSKSFASFYEDSEQAKVERADSDPLLGRATTRAIELEATRSKLSVERDLRVLRWNPFCHEGKLFD